MYLRSRPTAIPTFKKIIPRDHAVDSTNLHVFVVLPFKEGKLSSQEQSHLAWPGPSGVSHHQSPALPDEDCSSHFGRCGKVGFNLPWFCHNKSKKPWLYVATKFALMFVLYHQIYIPSQVLQRSHEVLAKRWAPRQGFPEEPLDNYMDVSSEDDN